MDDWEKKNEILECMDADDDEYDPFDLMLMLGYTEATIEEAEI